MHELYLLPQQFTTISVLGKSLAGIDIPILHITDSETSKDKKNILITGRMHPGESNSSHMLEGFIHFLNSNQKDAA
jgi:cytosolic carboxypeptidase protein 2/3